MINAFMKSLSAILLACAFAIPAEARVIIKEKTTYYTVSGKNGRAIYASIRRKGPKLGRSRHAIATTRSTVSVRNMKPVIRGRRCKLASVDVHLDLVYRYPRWVGKRSASPAVRKAWNQFIKRAIRHENKHGAIAKSQARKIHRALKSVSGRVSRECKDFGRKARRKFDSINSRAEREHARFDRRESRMLSRTARLQRALYRSQ